MRSKRGSSDHSSDYASGMGLVEVMVALALLAMATLSVSIISAYASRLSHAASRQQAAWRLASELAVWLRTRGDQALGALPENPALLLNKAESVNTISDCYEKRCDASDAAHFYLGDWYRRLLTSVPGARVMICQGGDGEGAVASQWQWTCNGDTADTSVIWLKLGWPQAGTNEFMPNIALKLLRTW